MHLGNEKQNWKFQFQLSELFKTQRGNNETLYFPVIEHSMRKLTVGWAEQSYFRIQKNKNPSQLCKEQSPLPLWEATVSMGPDKLIT